MSTQSGQEFFYKPEPRLPKFHYTEEGIRRLSLVIQATLKKRGWSYRRLAREAGIAVSTAGRYINGNINEPDEKILKYIAPFCYKPIRFVNNGVLLTDEFYDDWTEFAKLAGFESESELSISKMVHIAMLTNDLTQHQVEQELEKMIFSGMSYLSVQKFRQIQHAQEPNIDEEAIRVIRGLVDRGEGIFTEPQWMSAAKNPASWQGLRIKEDNTKYTTLDGEIGQCRRERLISDPVPKAV